MSAIDENIGKAGAGVQLAPLIRGEYFLVSLFIG